MPISAIITADIVNSTSLTPEDEKKLRTTINLLLKEYKFEFYRGDSFQIYIKDPHLALKVTLQTRAIARSLSTLHDVRSSIGIGQINTPVRDLKTSVGEAFILSGRAFDELTGDMRFSIQSLDEKANVALRVIAHYCDYIFKRLTSKQAAVVNELLKGRTQMEAAKKLEVTQATINSHAQSAGWAEIDKLLKEYQQVINQFKLS
jgi:hypothetical protein